MVNSFATPARDSVSAARTSPPLFFLVATFPPSSPPAPPASDVNAGHNRHEPGQSSSWGRREQEERNALRAQPQAPSLVVIYPVALNSRKTEQLREGTLSSYHHE